MFTYADMICLIFLVRYLYCRASFVSHEARRAAISGLWNIAAYIDSDFLAAMFLATSIQFGLAPEKAIAFLLVTFVLIVGTTVSQLCLQGRNTLLHLFNTFTIVMMLGTGIFATAAVIIIILYPTPANLAAVPNIPLLLGQLAVHMAPVMALIVMIPFANNLLHEATDRLSR